MIYIQSCRLKMRSLHLLTLFCNLPLLLALPLRNAVLLLLLSVCLPGPLLLPLQILLEPLDSPVHTRRPVPIQLPYLPHLRTRLPNVLQLELVPLQLLADLLVALDLLQTDVAVVQLGEIQSVGGLVGDQDVPVHVVGLHALQQGQHLLGRVLVLGQGVG